MASKKQQESVAPESLPFGAVASDGEARPDASQSSTAQTKKGERGGKKDWRRSEKRRGSARRGGRKRARKGEGDAAQAEGATEENSGNGAAPTRDERGAEGRTAVREAPAKGGEGQAEPEGERADRNGDERRRRSNRGNERRRRGRGRGRGDGGGGAARGEKGGERKGREAKAEPTGTAQGMLTMEKAGFGFLRRRENQFLPHKNDVHVSQRMVQRHKLQEGSIVEGAYGRGQGKHKYSLTEVTTVDGQPPKHWGNLAAFKKLTSIDPDFHYALGNDTDDIDLRIWDLVCPVGRGTRGLIVAPPRSGKTVLLQKFAKGMERIYPDVHLFVLLIDERPEEATDWQRSVEGEVFVSTNDEMARTHVQLAEAVWKRCVRLVEIGEDVVLVLDSITRLARAYNNLQSGGGRTMSGGLDTRTMERPKQFFGSARNTETAGSLTILGTTLVETGSRMDQVIFEEFKGTGNMELVLSRKLADRRIFPAIDIERSGTRKDEKLISSKQLRRVHTLRRVLSRMNFIEAMELLITKLEEVERNEDFLARFEVDPDA